MHYVIIMFFFLLSASEVWALNVAMCTKIEGGGKPLVIGQANLPDGTDLMVSISRKNSSYHAQAQAKVAHGEFRAGPFSQKGAAFNPGAYTLKITVPLAPTQPSSVQAIIGKHGEKLNGRLVKKSGILGNYAEYSTTFKIAGAVSAENDKIAQEKDKKDKHEWWLKSCKDICVASQVVYGQKTGKMYDFDWDRCYNKCLSEEHKK